MDALVSIKSKTEVIAAIVALLQSPAKNVISALQSGGNKMCIRYSYKFLLRRGKVAVDPLRKVTGPKKKKPLPVFLREGEMNRLLDEMCIRDRKNISWSLSSGWASRLTRA